MGSAPMTTMMREWEELGGSVVSEYGVLDNYTTWECMQACCCIHCCERMDTVFRQCTISGRRDGIE